MILCVFLIISTSSSVLICSNSQSESKRVVIDHHFPNLNRIIHRFKQNGYDIFLGKSDDFSILVTDSDECPLNSSESEIEFIGNFFQNDNHSKAKKGVKMKIDFRNVFLFLHFAFFCVIFYLLKFRFSRISSLTSPDLYIDIVRDSNNSQENLYNMNSDSNVSNIKLENGKATFWRKYWFRFTESFQLCFNIRQKYSVSNKVTYEYKFPITVNCDELEDSMDSLATVKSLENGECEIDLNIQDSEITLQACNNIMLKPMQNTTHYFLANILINGVFYDAIDSIHSLDDLKLFLETLLDKIDFLGLAIFTFYRGKFSTFYSQYKGDKKLEKIAEETAKNAILASMQKVDEKESNFPDHYATIEHYRICSMLTKMGFMKFVLIVVRNNNLLSFRLIERSFCHLASQLIPGIIITLMDTSGLDNVRRLDDLIKTHKTLDMAALTPDFKKTLKKIGNVDNLYILDQIEKLSKGERRLWDNKLSSLTNGTVFYKQQSKVRFFKMHSLSSNTTFINFALQRRPKLSDPLLQLASYKNIAFFRKDGTLIGGKNFFGTPFNVNSILDIIDTGQIPSHDSFLNFQISSNVNKKGYIKLLENPTNSVYGMIFPLFDEKIDCLNLVKVPNNQHFMIWLLDSSKLYPVWMMISQEALSSLSEPSVEGLYSICYPDDVATLKSSFDHALSVSTVSLTMELRLNVTSKKYEWHQITINRRSGHFILFYAVNIDEWKLKISLLQEMDQSLTTALMYGQIINWVFEDNYFPQRVYTTEPISKNHIVFNWTTIEHNVPGEYYEKVSNSLKETLETGKPLRLESPMIFDSIKWYSTYARVDQKTGTIVGFDFDITAVKEAEQQAAMQKKAAEEAAAAKETFLANISHEIKTPLNGISGLIELLQSSPSLDEEKREMVEVVHNAFHRLTDFLTDTLELAKIEQGKTTPASILFDPLSVLGELSMVAHELSKRSGVAIRSQTDPKIPLLVKGDPKFLVKVVSVVLSNAFKFTVQGYVKCKMSFTDDANSSNDENSKGMLVMTIKDTGIGMTDDVKTRIFQTFAQGDSSATRKYEGMGVGLALVKKMLDLVGGTISYETLVNVGTTFKIYFPVESIYEIYVPPKLKASRLQIFIYGTEKDKKMFGRYVSYFGFEVIINPKEIDYNRITLMFADNENQEQIDFALSVRENAPKLLIALISYNSEPKQKPGFMSVTRPMPVQQIQKIMIQLLWGKKTQKEEEVPTQGLKILLADENMTLAFVIKTLLERLDCVVVLANNGAEVIEYCQRKTFDIIFLDHHIPIVDGPTSIDIIRKLNSPNAKAPIIFMTSSLPEKQANINYGADYILNKPVTQQKLYDLLQIICRKINYQAFK